MTAAVVDGDHWRDYARLWEQVGPPLRPGPQDVAAFGAVLRRWLPTAARVLLLGVTPELAGMDWPADVRLWAVDRNAGMIRHCWPAPGASRSAAAVCAEWGRLPFADGTFDFVVGDGAFVVLDYARSYGAVLDELRRVVRPGGVLALRHFLRPEQAEAPHQVWAEALAGGIPNFHVFKWRLAHALHGGLAEGVAPARILAWWEHHAAAEPDLLRRCGWAAEQVETLSVYRGSTAVYTFPTRSELAHLFAGTTTLEEWRGDYPLATLCPVVVHRLF